MEKLKNQLIRRDIRPVPKNKLCQDTINVNISIEVVKQAEKWLLSQQTDCRILMKQTRNLGDTLHMTPVARHYKVKNPNCKIAFIVGDKYASVHQYNTDFDKIFEINANLNPQERIKIGNYMISIKTLNFVIVPSIHPFGQVWKSHVWSHPIISHQYFANSYIKPPESILGGGKLKAPIINEDIQFAKKQFGGKKLIALEYASYSHPLKWKAKEFAEFVTLVSNIGYICVSFAGKNEGMIAKTIDARGMTWRRTIAILSLCDFLIGVGSGVTMLACCANPQPHIIELDISNSIQMKSCGYSDNSISLNASPLDVYKYIKSRSK